MNLFELTYQEIVTLLQKKYGKGAWHARALLREVIREGNPEYHHAPEFKGSPRLLEELGGDVEIPVPMVVKEETHQDTVKFLTRLGDGNHIESVVIPMKNYNTLCVSTQVGCRMGCRFCETAGMGFTRDLKVHEITGQLYSARFTLKKKISNIVFMGMGEPFDNVENVIRSINVFSDQRGFDVALRHQTVSTCGLLPGIERLAQENLGNLRLAVSLNASSDHIRSELMPVNRRYGLDKLLEALRKYPLKARNFILAEYILIKGVNDSDDDALKLAECLSSIRARVNVIPFNPGKKAVWSSPGDDDVHRFSKILEDKGLFVVKRWSKGRDLSAGCGQLAVRQSGE